MLTEIDNSETAWPEIDIRPDLRVLIAGSALVALVSAATLSAPLALASTVLGALMIAGADVDARTYLLPDLVTLGALACGVIAQFALDPFSPLQAAGPGAHARRCDRAGAHAGALGICLEARARRHRPRRRQACRGDRGVAAGRGDPALLSAGDRSRLRCRAAGALARRKPRSGHTESRSAPSCALRSGYILSLRVG